MKVAIVGGGGVGSAAARHLAKEGHEVTVFERFTADHDQGSSFGESRVTRKTYPDALLTELMTAAYPLWDELQDEAGENLFVRAGGLYFGRRDHPHLQMICDALARYGVPFERFEAKEANARFPGFRLKDGEIGVCQADTGFLRASACVRANLRLAQKHGAELRENTQVLDFVPDGDGFRVLTDAGDTPADRVVLTAGPWLGRFLTHLPLKVTRQQYVYLKPARYPERFQAGTFPVWIEAQDPKGLEMYGFPMDGRVDGVKLAQHAIGPVTDPDAVDRNLDPRIATALRAYAAERMPDLSGEITYSKTCLYTVTPDRVFLIDEAPGKPGAVYVGGLCGEGFKFTVLFGKIAADLVLGRKPRWELSRFRASRL
ncbi:MAG: N-methyl-L-tryptophan oxidase [Planctomycetota bacterium]|nr:N-methyl-L-tryptophan oxidase [Planctomycetota bacterium]